jgi:hypothetical protein
MHSEQAEWVTFLAKAQSCFESEKEAIAHNTAQQKLHFIPSGIPHFGRQVEASCAKCCRSEEQLQEGY